MADKDEHLKQAHHNEEFLEYLRENISIYADWYTICIYYTALHYIEAYLDILFLFHKSFPLVQYSYHL